MAIFLPFDFVVLIARLLINSTIKMRDRLIKDNSTYKHSKKSKNKIFILFMALS